MRYLNRFEVASLTLLAFLLSTPPISAAPDIRLGDDVRPTFQQVFLELDADQPDYRGKVQVDLEVQRSTRQILLHSEEHELEKVTLRRGDRSEIPLRHEMVDPQTLRIETEETLVPGALSLEIQFKSSFGTRAVGLYRTEKDGHGYSFTQFEADDAREAFPCWDEPGFKFPYQMTLKVPEGHLAITNTPVVEESTADGWRTFVFAKTKPLPSYLLALATGPLEVVPMPGLGVPANIVTPKGQGHLTGLALEMTPPLLKAMEAYFGSPYPYTKLDFIAVPEFWPGAMENPGAVTYADDVILLDPKAASIQQKRRMASIIAHELAHQWFGNLVTMTWWDDLWLNESFANWMGDKISREVFPELGGAVSASQRMQQVLGVDARTTTDPIRRPVDTAKNLLQGIGVTYQKGSAVLNMFEHWLGPEAFRQGVRDYLNAHTWGNAVAADLWRALDKASNKKLAASLATFIEQAGHPLIDVEILDGGKVSLRQERFRNHGAESPDQLWRVPVVLKYASGNQVHQQTVFLSKEQSTVDLLHLAEGVSTPDWLFPQGDAIGYYRWRLAPEVLRQLANQASEALSARERIAFLGNSAALFQAGALSGSDYVEIVGSLAGDEEPQVLSSVMGELGRVYTGFVSSDLTNPFNTWVLQTLEPAYARHGFDRQPGESEVVALVRPQLISWLGYAGHGEVSKRAAELTRSYMENPVSVDPGLVGTALSLTAFRGDRELFDKFRELFESAETPVAREHFLRALGAFSDPELRQAALDYALEGPLRPTELFGIGQRMGFTPAGRDAFYFWFTENYDQIIQRIPPMFLSFAPRVASGCSLERLEHAKEFFSHPDRNPDGTAKMLSQVDEEVHNCIGLRNREGEAVARYLHEFAANHQGKEP